MFQEFAAHQQAYSDTSALPTPVFFYGIEKGEEVAVEIERGKTLIIKFLNVGDPHPDGRRTVFFELNGQPREATVQDHSLDVAVARHPKADPSDPRQIAAPMPGLVVTVAIQPGDTVTKGQKLVVLEAMKMETVLCAASDGCVAELLLVFAVVPSRGDMITVNFEATPNLPTQPNTFAGAGPSQTIIVPGIGTFTGGAVLGNPTFLAAFTLHGSPPNAYGTANFAGPTYSPNITLTISPSILVSNIAGVLFNGETSPQTFSVTAFSGATQVGQQTFSNVPANTNPNGFANFSVSAASITSLVFAEPSNGPLLDYFIDTVNITFTPAVVTVPEPSSLVLFGLGAMGTFAAYRGQRRILSKRS